MKYLILVLNEKVYFSDYFTLPVLGSIESSALDMSSRNVTRIYGDDSYHFYFLNEEFDYISGSWINIFELDKIIPRTIVLMIISGIYSFELDITNDIIESNCGKVTEYLNKNNYIVNTIVKQANSIHGKLNNGQIFFKTGKPNSIFRELIGYIRIMDSYPVTKLMKIIFGEILILLFEYESSLNDQQQLLHHILVGPNFDESMNPFEGFLDCYLKNSKTTYILDRYPLQEFFKNRISTRLIPWYKNGKDYKGLFSKSIVVNNIEVPSFFQIIDEIEEYFENSPLLRCFLSQGDPTEMNISVSPFFLDYDTSGINPFVAEASIFIWSIFIGGNYFYPKYHPEAYMNCPVEINYSYSPHVTYDIRDDKLYVHTDYTLHKSRVICIDRYLSIFHTKINENSLFDFKCHLIMRVISTLNISLMDYDDLICSLGFVAKIYSIDNNTYLLNVKDFMTMMGAIYAPTDSEQ